MQLGQRIISMQSAIDWHDLLIADQSDDTLEAIEDICGGNQMMMATMSAYSSSSDNHHKVMKWLMSEMSPKP